MNMEIRISTPIILILVGFGFLLANLNIIPLNPWQAFVVYWPAFLIFAGAYHLVKVFVRFGHRGTVSVSGLLWSGFWILLGFYLLAPRVGWDIVPLSWNVIWPTALILLGLSQILQNRFRIFSGSSDADGPMSSFVGEIHKGGASWVLDDMHIRHGVGEVHLDLTKAIIPDREVNIDIGGMVGEVTIYVPADLPIQAFCETSIGDITILDKHREGIGNSLHWKSVDYDHAVRKVNLDIHWKIGEIKVRSIG